MVMPRGEPCKKQKQTKIRRTCVHEYTHAVPLIFTWLFCVCVSVLASFPGPAQLSIACSTEKQEMPWYISSRVTSQVRKGVERL